VRSEWKAGLSHRRSSRRVCSGPLVVHAPRLMTRGFGLIALLIAVAIVGLASAVTANVSSLARRRESEDQLLYVGDRYRRAIQAYVESTPTGQSPYPQRLEDLLKDPRYPGVRRYLRSLYVDPMTGRNDWVAVPAPTGGVMGVHSASDRSPIKLERFGPPYQDFAHRASYVDWNFCFPACVPLQELSGSS
jgi:type II secretory pathway pseudopilin PulG